MEVSRKMVNMLGSHERDLNFKETELCLGLPGGGGGSEPDVIIKATGKRGFSETVDLKLNLQSKLEESVSENASKEKNLLTCTKDPAKPPAKAQVVGWPPVRSYRKNMMMAQNNNNNNNKNELEGDPKAAGGSSRSAAAALVKVCMDGAPYLRKVDLKMYKSYQELSDALAKMFSSFTMGNYGDQGMIDFMNESKLMDLLNSSEYVPTYEDKDGDWMLVGDVPWEMFVDSCKRLRIMKGSEAIGLVVKKVEGTKTLMARAKIASTSTVKLKKPSTATTTTTIPSNMSYPISPQLGKFLGSATESSRTLQDPANKREIFCDEKLKFIFNGKGAVGFQEITKLLSIHFVKSG